MSPLETLEQELANLSAEYEAQFAGKPRNTRNLDNLARLIARTQQVVTGLSALPDGERGDGTTFQRLRESATGSLDIYRTEQRAIQEAKSAGPLFEEMAELATSANFVFARYGRHFAGHSRSTRDLSLLNEMIDDLEPIERRMEEIVAKQAAKGPVESFTNDLNLVRRSLALYRAERPEIEKAQTPAEHEVRGSLLANLANDQMRIYRVHFAGRSRLSRRPGLLQRVIAQLGHIHHGMTHLKRQGLVEEFNDKNIGIVETNLRMYRSELAEIRKLRQQNTLQQLMAALAEEANNIFAEYRSGYAGKDRRTVDGAALSELCDRLGEVRRQMREMGRAQADADNSRNLEIVTEQLGMFEQEFVNIRQAQQKPPAS